MKRKNNGTPSGFRDLMPPEAMLKEYVVGIIASVYRQYGFLPIETPIVEFTSTLVGEVTDFNLFAVTSSKAREHGEADPLALRFDQTVPLARFMAENQNISKPFKRYVFGPVFRGERPQAGRYRQFDQFDADIVGTNNIAADIEVILMMRDVLSKIGVRFVIKVNTRKLLDALPSIFGFSEDKLRDVLIVLDKRDKISRAELQKQLGNQSLDNQTVEALIDFCNISGNPKDVVEKLNALCANTIDAKQGLADLNIIRSSLEAVSANDSVVFDMSVIRGLAYYTGAIFETILLDASEFGSVYSGGRYDNLVENFGVSQQPAVGASVGVDRLIAALSKINFKPKEQAENVIVLIQDSNALDYAFSIAEKVRSEGKICEVYTGSKKKIGEQLSYANQKAYTYALIVGSNEYQSKTITIKNLNTGVQENKHFDSFTI